MSTVNHRQITSIRFNDFEIELLEKLSEKYRLNRSEIIRMLIRDKAEEHGFI